MVDKLTPAEFVLMYVRAWSRLDYDAFVTNVLKSTPREGDTWQEEKFRLFQDAGVCLACLSLEHVENTIDYAQQLNRVGS